MNTKTILRPDDTWRHFTKHKPRLSEAVWALDFNGKQHKGHCIKKPKNEFSSHPKMINVFFSENENCEVEVKFWKYVNENLQPETPVSPLGEWPQAEGGFHEENYIHT